VWSDAIRNAGLQTPLITAEIVGSVMGLEHRDLVQRIFPNLTDEVRDPLMQACYAGEIWEWTQANAESLLYPGVYDGLKRLAGRYQLVVVSNCQAPYLEAFLAITSFGPLIRDSECFGRTGRPKAENIAGLVKRHGLASPLYIGDTSGDESAAREAGVSFVHASYGFGRVSTTARALESFAALTQWLVV
jgi:phosphoglycolate phosphatase